MNNIEKYQGRLALTDSVRFQNTPETESVSILSLIIPILRRWRILLLTFSSICIFAIPSIWLAVKPFYQATAAIRVSPVISSILFGGNEGIPMYKNFLYTQADLIASDKVLQRVADDLMDKNPMFFKKPDNSLGIAMRNFTNQKYIDPVAALRNTIKSGNLRIAPENNTELIKISMKSAEPKQAEQIVNSFVQSYMAIVVSDEVKGEDHKLTVLENERRLLTDKLERQRQMINEMAQEYGTQSLTSRQEMMLKRVAALQGKLTEFEMEKIALKVKMQMLNNKQNQTLQPEQLFRMRYEFINTDLMVQTLTTNVTQLDQGLIVAKQQLASTNPQLQRKEELLEVMKQRLKERRSEVGNSFDKMIAKELAGNDKGNLKNAQTKLEQITAYENHLRAKLAEEDSETIELGRKQLAIQDLQDQLNLTKELYETVRRRIQELEMERKRPARISEAYYANTAPLYDKRTKYTMAVLFGAMALSMLAALLRDKFDLSLRTPNDFTKSFGVRIVGTTTRRDSIAKSLLPLQIADDYQTICANIGLFSGEGIPSKLVVTSPRQKEGKTTLAINLAKNIAKTGKKVLLVDGDLRKPDIVRLLKLPCKHNALKDILNGRRFEEIIWPTSLAGLDILPAISCKTSEIYKLIANWQTNELVNVLSHQYDHIIIDTPPVLAVPDALLWAKMAEAVLLTGFSGYTEGPSVKETLERFVQINVKVIGIVLNNVPLNYSYNSYGYGYSAGMSANM